MTSSLRPGGPLLLILATAAFVSLAATRLCDAMLPALATSFVTSTVEASAVVSAYAIAYGLMQLAWGPVGDRFGKLQVVGFAALACALVTAVAASSQSLLMLVVSRAAMGAVAAAIFPLGLAWISDTVPLQQRQQALARFSGVSVFGMVAGPLLGGWLSQAWSWRGAFLVVAAMFAGIGAVVWRQARALEAGPRGDAMSQGGLVSGLAGLWASRWARTILIAACIEAGLGIGCLALLPTVLYDRFGLPLDKAGATVALFGLGGFLFSRCAPSMLARLPRQLMPALGSGILGLGIGALALIPQWGWAAPACIAAGFGFFTLHNTLQVQATQLSPQATGLTFSVFTAVIFVGQSTGVSLAAVTYDRVGEGWVFGTAAAAIVLLGLTMTALLRRQARPAA